MSEFHDPELRQQLGRLSGPYPDDNAAFAAWQRRVGQARRRRAVAWSSGAAVALVMATVGVAALQHPTRHSLVSSNSTEAGTEVSTSTPTTEADQATVLSTVPKTTAPTTPPPVTAPITIAADQTSIPQTEPTEAAGSGRGPGPTSGRGPGSSQRTPGSSAPAAPTTQAQAPAPQTVTQTFGSDGGSITVRQDGEQLTIIAFGPAPGFETDHSDASGREVTVTFKSSNHRSEISVKVSGGAMAQQISEHDDGHQETAPTDSTGGDHSGGGSGKG